MTGSLVGDWLTTHDDTVGWFTFVITPGWLIDSGVKTFAIITRLSEPMRVDAFYVRFLPPTWGLLLQTTNKIHVCRQALSLTLPQSGSISRRGRWGNVGVSDSSVGALGWCLGGCTWWIRSSDPWQLPIKQPRMLTDVQSISSGSSSTRSTSEESMS